MQQDLRNPSSVAKTAFTKDEQNTNKQYVLFPGTTVFVNTSRSPNSKQRPWKPDSFSFRGTNVQQPAASAAAYRKFS